MLFKSLTAIALAGLLFAGPAAAASNALPFSFSQVTKDAKSDPNGIWSSDDFTPPPGGSVSIYTYSLNAPDGRWIASQIWNENCGSSTCPTRLVFIDKNGVRTLRLEADMQQVIPPGSALADLPQTAEFAKHPFKLAGDAHALIAGDNQFKIPPRK